MVGYTPPPLAESTIFFVLSLVANFCKLVVICVEKLKNNETTRGVILVYINEYKYKVLYINNCWVKNKI